MPLTVLVWFAGPVTRRAKRAATDPHMLAAVVDLSARTCRGSIGSTALTSRAVTKTSGVPPGHPGAGQIAGWLETGKSGKSEQNRPWGYYVIRRMAAGSIVQARPADQLN